MIRIRRVEKYDSLDIFNWRNDKLTRIMSHNNNIIKWNDHVKWFSASLKNKNKIILICEECHTKEKVGVVHFDFKGTKALVSINLSPKKRGKGKANVCLQKAIAYFKNNYPLINTFIAEIKSINFASQASFLKIGFIKIKQKSNIHFYEL